MPSSGIWIHVLNALRLSWFAGICHREHPVLVNARLVRKAMAIVFRRSRGGFIAAGLFLVVAAVVFAWVFFVASRNPADSGESGILLLPFAMPWVSFLPGAWLGLWAGLGCIFLNALLLYCVFGGLRIASSAR